MRGGPPDSVFFMTTIAYVGISDNRPISVHDKRTRLSEVRTVGTFSATPDPCRSRRVSHSHRTRPVATMAQVGPVERRTRARDGHAGGNAFARSVETARTVPRVRVARASPRSDARCRETCRRGAVRLTGARETTDADVASTPRLPLLDAGYRSQRVRAGSGTHRPRAPRNPRGLASLPARARRRWRESVLFVAIAGFSPPAVCADKIRHPGPDARRRRRDRGARD